LGYGQVQDQLCSHQDFGGVTISRWGRIGFGVRDGAPNDFDMSVKRMTAGLYHRHLQTALDDTIGPAGGRCRLEKFKTSKTKIKVGEPIGTIADGTLVYDSDGLAPDFRLLSHQEMGNLWVQAASVFSKVKVLRKVSRLELLAIWDYAGKIWYKGMDNDMLQALLEA
jgi:hypothetical protein